MPPNRAGGAPRPRDLQLERGAPLGWKWEPLARGAPGTLPCIPHLGRVWGCASGTPSSPGAGHWERERERGESARLMILPPRRLDTAHLAKAVGRCDENQAAQLGGEETLWWEKRLDTGALFLLFSMRFSFWLPPSNSWHLCISLCRALDRGVILVIQTFWETGFIKEV